MSICKGNSWTAQTLRKKNKQNKFITKQNMKHWLILTLFCAEEMLQLTLSTSLLMRKNRYSKLRGMTPLSSSVKLSNSDGPRARGEKIILLLDVKEFVIHNVNNILNSHRAWWTFSLSRFVHCRHKRGTRKGIEVIAPENILNFILYIKNIKTTY